MEPIKCEDMIISSEIKTEPEMGSARTEYSFPCVLINNEKIINAAEEKRLLELDSELQEEFYAVAERMKFEEIITTDMKPFVLSEYYEIAKVSGLGNFYATSSFVPICRLCATPNHSTIHIFGEDEVQRKIIKQIEYCLPITISEIDNLSKEACQSCLEKLEFVYEFQKAVSEADKQQRFMSYASTIAAKALTSGLEKSSERYSQTSTQCNETELRTIDDKILRTSSTDEDTNNNELKTIPQELRIKNTTIEADMIIPNSKLYFEDLIPLKTHYTPNNPDKKIRMRRASIIEHQGADSSTHPSKNPSNFDTTTSASQSKNGIFCSPPNSPISEAQLEEILKLDKKMCNSKLDAPTLTTRSHEISDSRGSECIANDKDGDDKNHEDIIFCENVFFDKEALDAEENVEDGIMKCRICGDSFPTAKRCCTHGEIHFARNYYPCCLCGEILETEKRWMEHIVEHYEGEDENRKSTRAKTRSSKEYEKKIGNNVKELKLKLRLRKLDKKFTIINAEELKHCSEKRDKISEKNKPLRPHVPAIQRIHDNKKSSDNSSEKQLFRVPEEPEASKEKHGLRFNCTSCKKKFRSKNLLEVHKKNYCRLLSTRRVFSCSHCKKEFMHKSSMIIHLRNHTGERPYTCEFCEKTFTTKASRDCHRRIHTGEKPFQCLTCEKSFARNASLRQHTSVHSEDKPYKCPLCPQFFKTASSRNNHKRLHLGKRPYECNLCGFHFKRKHHMLKHRDAGTCRDKATAEN